jgi:hypothetical protein
MPVTLPVKDCRQHNLHTHTHTHTAEQPQAGRALFEKHASLQVNADASGKQAQVPTVPVTL